jgi:hypothetical protein
MNMGSNMIRRSAQPAGSGLFDPKPINRESGGYFMRCGVVVPGL